MAVFGFLRSLRRNYDDGLRVALGVGGVVSGLWGMDVWGTCVLHRLIRGTTFYVHGTYHVR